MKRPTGDYCTKYKFSIFRKLKSNKELDVEIKWIEMFVPFKVNIFLAKHSGFVIFNYKLLCLRGGINLY